jgi:single-strand DNA-binding protein
MSVRSLNKVLLIGNLTRDPNLRYTPNGTAVCSFGLATNRTWTPAEGGEKQERAEFHNIVAWSKLADICGQLLHKGDKIYVEGRLQTRDWKGEDGTDRKTTEVVIDNMILLRSRSGMGEEGYEESGADEQEAPAPRRQKKQAPAADQVDDVEDVADDVPF